MRDFSFVKKHFQNRGNALNLIFPKGSLITTYVTTEDTTLLDRKITEKATGNSPKKARLIQFLRSCGARKAHELPK